MTGIVTFGDALLSTGDLDPVYLAIQSAKLEPAVLHRLCLAYWCFYSLGTAAYIAHHGKKPSQFWELMMMAAVNEQRAPGIPTGLADKPWPRGAERRHFRAANAIKPMEYLSSAYKDASAAIVGMTGAAGSFTSFAWVASHVEAHPGFGPWMSFKIADMAERVLGRHVAFNDCALDMYKDPTQGAAIGYWELLHTSGKRQEGPDYGKEPWKMPVTGDQIKESADHYVALFNKRHKIGSVPGLKRPLNIQEIETIFCKYKSHLKGHYPLGKDTREVGHGLEGWGPLADKLRLGLPQPQLV